MKKTIQKVFSLVLAVTLVCSLAVGVNAKGFSFTGLQDWFREEALPQIQENLEELSHRFEPHWPTLPDIPPLENCPSKHFTDVDTARWYHPGVDFCVKRGLMIGTSATTFEPYANVTRAQLVTMLWRQAGSPAPAGVSPFYDVGQQVYYSKAVAWAYENDIVTGVSEKEFQPNAVLSRQDMAVILYRYTEHYLGIEPFLGIAVDLEWLFPDGGAVSAYAVDAVRWTVARTLILGENNSAYQVMLNPKGLATRAQIANVFCRYCVTVLGWLK